MPRSAPAGICSAPSECEKDARLTQVVQECRLVPFHVKFRVERTGARRRAMWPGVGAASRRECC
eukprot:8209042-Lingulodinium_polyedra.AAC.1